MSVKYYNHKTAQWETMATSQASGTKVLDTDGVLVQYDENGEAILRPNNVEDALKSVGRKIKNIEEVLEDHFTNHPSGGGGGGNGDGGIMPKITIKSPEVISTTVDEDVIFEFQFSSPNVGIATAYLEVSGTENRAYQMTLKRQGNFVGAGGWNLGKFPMGTYSISMYVVDAGGMYATMDSTCVIRSGSLTLTSDFISTIDYGVNDNIVFPYHVQSISDDPITIKYQIDNNDIVSLENIVNGSYGEIEFGQIPVAGSHKIQVWAESTNMKSNVLTYNILIVDAIGMYLSVELDKEEFDEGEAINIYYRASKRNEAYASIFFYINGVQSGTTTVSTGGRNLWNLGKSLDAGEYSLKIKARTLDTTDSTENLETNTAIWEGTINVKSGDFVRKKPIIDGSELFVFDASGLSGEGNTNILSDGTKEYVWLDKGRNNIKCTLHDFNFTASEGGNGWGDDALKFSGKSYAVIDCTPFNNSTTTGILANGFTLEVCFSALDVGNPDASVLWCKNHLAPNQGVSVTPYVANLKSQDGINMTTTYMDSIQGEKWTTLAFSIKHGASGAMCYIYVNGVLTRIEPCISSVFKYGGKIYLGAGLLEDGTLGNFAKCSIRSVRAYNRQLSYDNTTMHDELLDNYISDLTLEEQIYAWNLNYGTETIPTIDIYHPNFFQMTQDDTFNCGIKFTNPMTGHGFDLTDQLNGEGSCPVKIQGTSSKEYPVKNYEFTLMQNGAKFPFAPYETWKEGSTFTIKANYMDSSNANNVAVARFYNDLTKAYNPLPSQRIDSNYRASIDGFPVRLRVNGIFSGIYTFNMDRYAHENYGYSNTRQDIAYEIASNGDKFAVGSNTEETKTMVSTGFKYRYHYSDNGLQTGSTVLNNGALNMASGLHEDLLQLVLWTATTDGTEFKGEFKKHWATENLIDYYLLCMVFGLVDSLMKNMVIASYGTSDDGEGNRTRVWYPLVYDGDSALGLNNQGQLIETPGCDTTWNGIKFGDYDTSDSNLWTKFVEHFDEEIRDRYARLRLDGWFTVEKLMSYIYDDVIAKVGQKFYNEDMKYKYQDGALNLSKRDFCRGTREEYTRRWLFERLSYLDSRFQRGDDALSTAVIRANVTGVISFTVETYHPQWVSVQFLDNTTPVYKRVMGTAPVTFSSTECPDIPNGFITNGKNNNIKFTGVKHIKSIGGIDKVQASEISIQHMSRLTQLNVRGSKSLFVLDVLNNTNLQTLNVKDCVNLGWNDSAKIFDGTLNLSNCVNLKYCDISNTGLTGLQLSENTGSLEYFDASNTNIDTLRMVGQPYIEEIKMSDCYRLGNVVAENCSRLSKLNLGNTTISDLTISLCLGIEHIDISGTSNLNNLTLAGCPNLKVLNMSGFKSPLYNVLNLSTCPKIEELYLGGATNLVKVTFAETSNKLKVLDISSSSIESARFGQNVDFPDYFDLGQFDLTSIKFTNNTRIKHIKNLNYTGSGNQTFSGCTSLHTIHCKEGGKLKLTGSLNQTFRDCKALTVLPNTLDLSASTSSSEAFHNCSKINMTTAKMIMDSVKNTGLSSGTHWRFFSGCSNIQGQLPSDFFANASSLSGMDYFFSGTGINGQLPEDLLQPMKDSLTNLNRAFAGLSLTGNIPTNFFRNLTRVTNIDAVFSGCTQMTGQIPEGLFKDMVNLTNAYGVFLNNYKLYGKVPSDLFSYNTKLRYCNEALKNCFGLVGDIPETIFTHPEGYEHSELYDISGMFQMDANVKNSNQEYYVSGINGTTFPTNLLANTPNILDVNNLFNGLKNIVAPIPNYFFQYTPLVQNVSYCFANTGAKGMFPGNIFKGLTGLTNVAGFFQNNSGISGNIPTTLFSDNKNLTIIDYLFEGCKGIQGTIPENLFFGLEEDTEEFAFNIQSAKGVFKKCSTLTGYVPDKLLYKFKMVEDLSEFFAYCYELRGDIPKQLLSKCERLKKVNHMFAEANGIGNRNVNTLNPYCIPEELFENNYLLESTAGMFSSWGDHPSASGITHGLQGQIPPGLFENKVNLLDVSSMFAGQNGINGELSGDLFRFNPNIENLSSTFGGCSGITSLGDGFLSENQKVNNVYWMFYECSNMVGTMTPIWKNNYCPNIPSTDNTKFQNCFKGCTKLTNYHTEIPSQWGGGYNPPTE